MRRTYHVIIVTLLLLALRGSARAEGYRAPVTVADLVGGAGFAIGVELGTDTAPGMSLAVGGGIIAALGAPILHGAEGNTGRMVASFILRGGLPVIGWQIGVRVAQASYKKFRHGAGIIGFMSGYAVATIVDIAMASSSDTPSKNKRAVGFGFSF
jgi:hypothetical protein